MDVLKPVGCATVVYCSDGAETTPEASDGLDLGAVGLEPTIITPDSLIANPERALAHASVLIIKLDSFLGHNAPSHSTTANVDSPELLATGLRILRAIQKVVNRPQIILLTRNGTPLDVCCTAVQLGVSSFVDIDSDNWRQRLSDTVAQALDHKKKQTIRKPLSPTELLDAVGIRAVSPAMQNLIVLANRAAQVSDATVLIHGESGTGKQLLAEAIHRLDPKRGQHPFVPVNCAAITGTLAESELFGHVRGAFSGATGPRDGYFKSAHKGTIMLDEISELPMSLQPKLLRVLQEGRVLSVGSDREEIIDVRVIAASNVSLQEKVANGTFRLDLYQRLNVIHLSIPPLRQRAEDIPLLVMHFLEKYQAYCTQEITEVDPRVYEILKRRMGNGNVRELENIVRQTLVFKQQGNRLELSDLPLFLLAKPEEQIPAELIPSAIADNLVSLIRDGRLSLKDAIGTFEKALILRAAQNSPDLTKGQLAQVLGLPRRTLYYKMDATEQKS